MLESIAKGVGCECQRLADRIRLSVGLGSRHQEIDIRILGDEYELTSVVLSASEVTATDDGWRALARLAWQRNSDTEIVTFTFDGRDRLVGRIRHPVETLDIEELSLYIHALVRECDRFEYLLSGKDIY